MRRADRRRARPRRRPRSAHADVRVPPLLPAVHRRRVPAAGASGRARPLRVVPRLRALGGAVGRAADPGQRRVLLRELDARAGRRVLPEPGGRDRVAAAARHLGRDRRGQSRAGDAACPTSRRSSCARGPAVGHGTTAECFLVPIDACYELVGELRRLWRGFDGGSEAHAALDAFFERVRAKARPLQRPEDARDEPARRSRCSAPGPSRTPRCRRWCCGCGSPRPTATPVHAVALRCQIIIEPQRRRYDARRGGAG